MLKWEYKVISLDLVKDGHSTHSMAAEEGQEELLNALGQEGWELVSIAVMYNPYFPPTEYAQEAVDEFFDGSAYFKRPFSEERY